MKNDARRTAFKDILEEKGKTKEIDRYVPNGSPLTDVWDVSITFLAKNTPMWMNKELGLFSINKIGNNNGRLRWKGKNFNDEPEPKNTVDNKSNKHHP